jgi:hypothetical protein
MIESDLPGLISKGDLHARRVTAEGCRIGATEALCRGSFISSGEITRQGRVFLISDPFDGSRAMSHLRPAGIAHHFQSSASKSFGEKGWRSISRSTGHSTAKACFQPSVCAMRRSDKASGSDSPFYHFAQAALRDEWLGNPDAARVADTGELESHRVICL